MSNLPDLPREPPEAKPEFEEPGPYQKESLEVVEPHPEPEEFGSESPVPGLLPSPFVRASSQEEADALGGLLKDLKQLPRSHTIFRRSILFDLQAAAVGHSHGPSLQCPHDVLQILWPKVNVAVERFMMEEVQPKIQQSLPGPLRSFCFRRFKLGRGVPQVLEVEVSDAPCRSLVDRQGVELRVAFNLESEVAIVLSLLGLSAGLSYLSMKGSAVIRLDPLLNELPVVGGIVVYFVDAPSIDFRLGCGPMQVSNWAFVRKLLQDLLSSATTALLLPNVINIPLVDDEDVVDTATLRDAKPLGILRVAVANVTPKRTARLFSNWPQVRLQLCAEEWTCPATPAQPCCWERKQPKGRISIQLQGLVGLDVLGTYVRVQMGQQSYCTETASEDSSWIRCSPISFDVDVSEQTLRLEVHRAGNFLWHRSVGFVDIKVGSFASLQPGAWNARSEGLHGADQVNLQFDVWYEPVTGRRNFHDFFVYDWNQKLAVSLRDLNNLGLSTTVAVAKPRKVSQLVAGGPDTWKMYLHDQGLDTEVLQETRGEVELSLDWLEVLPDLADAFDCLVECRFDEVYAPSSFSAEMLAMRACIGNVMKQTPLAQRKEQEFKVETILRLPVTRSAVETETLELAAVDGRGNVCASLLLRLRHLKSGKLLQSKLRMDGASSKLDAQVSLKCSGLGSRVQAERQRWKSRESGLEQTDETPIHLDWVNMVCRRLHPKIITLAARQLEDPFGVFTQSLRLKMPLPLQDIHFSHFLLGTTPPEVGPFEVSEWQHPHDGSMGIEMKVGFNLDTEANIEMQVHGIKLGINRMFLKGDLLIRLEPLIDEIPVIGGIVVCFLNQPEVEFQYSGLAARVDSNILRSLLQSAVAQALVLPQVVKIPIGTEEQNVDRALLDPAPVGVLRIWALRARDLPSSWPLGSRSRSPYMDVSLETEQWQTSVVYHSTSPEWNEKHDFLVFDKRQEVGIRVCDSKSLFLRNVIAAAPPIPVDDLVFQSEQEVELLNCDHGDDVVSPVHPSSSSPAGTAVLRFEWLNFVRPGRRGPDSRHLLRVKLDEIVVPTELLDVQKATVLDPTLVKMRAKVREVTKDTPAVAWFPADSSMGEASASGTNVGTVELDLEHTLFLLINAVDLDAGALELELRNGNDKILGSAQIKISDVLAAGGMKWRDNRRLALKHATGKCLADVEVSIQGLRLAQECVTGF